MNDERCLEDLLEELKDLITNNPLTLEDIALRLNISRGESLELCDLSKAKQKGIYFYYGKISASFETSPFIQSEVKRKRLVEENKRLRALNKDLTSEMEKLQKLEGFNLLVKEPIVNDNAEYNEVSIETDTTESESLTALLCFSDWHIGETVDPNTINNINLYTKEIAKERALSLFSKCKHNIKKQIDMGNNVEKIVVWLGGDFISGYIHPELEESNSMSPTEESIFLVSLLKEGFNMLSSLFLPITVITSYGNHGRTTMKKRHSTGAINNFEYLVYRLLKDNIILPVDEWLVSESSYSFLNIYNKVIRFHHGDNIRSGGRITFTSSVLKKIKELDEHKPCDLDIFGHFHSLHFNQKFITNGSLVGPSAFSYNLGFPPEPPQQALIYLSNTHPSFVKSYHSIAFPLARY